MPNAGALCPGSKVWISGLSSAAHLNGAQGKLLAFDSNSGCWEVETKSDGFKKIKPANILPLSASDCFSNASSSPRSLGQRCKKNRLCRFGTSCWRPNCHFAHEDNAGRCKQFATSCWCSVALRQPKRRRLCCECEHPILVYGFAVPAAVLWPDVGAVRCIAMAGCWWRPAG